MLRGIYLTFGEGPDRDTNAALHRHAETLRADLLEGVTDIVPGYTTLYLEYDARKLNGRSVRRWAERPDQARPNHARPNQSRADETERVRTVEIPVRYDGPDLGDICERTGLTRGEVVERHSGSPYHVYAVGFTPGFPFMGEVDKAIRLPRRQTPRARVDAHSVALAGSQTGIYPLPSPGGWHLLGTALKVVYDPHRAEPFLLRPGDEVLFVPAQGETPPPSERLELLPLEPHTPMFRVHEPGLLDLVVDEGRFLAGHFGLSRSGPLDAPLAALANRLLGNAPGAPLVELTLTGPVLEALAAGVVAVTGWSLRAHLNGEAQTPFSSFAVRRGDVLTFTPTPGGCRSYLAVAGGLESGRFWNSASTDLKGLIGRPLRAGDVLGRQRAAAPRPGRCFVPYRRSEEETTLRLQPGPQASPEALAGLAEHPFTVASADRMGVRLEGASITGGDVISEATPLGAVQVTSGGAPILLLHDRGSVGGYAKPALLYPADLGRAAQLRPGERVRFVVDEDFGGLNH